MISVAMTSYNGEKYIEEQLNSIINQTVCVDEIVVVDDKSLDGTVDVIKNVISDCDKGIKIRLIENDVNLGYTMNFYKAIGQTTGDYIFLADQDDVWENNKVEILIGKMKGLDAEVICSNFDVIDENGVQSGRHYYISEFIENAKEGVTTISLMRLMLGNVSQGCTYCFTKKVQSIYLDICYEEIIHDYQILMIGAAMKKAYFLNEKLIHYRIHGNNAIGLEENKLSGNISLKIRHRVPRIVTFLKRLKKYENVDTYYKCIIIQYLRIPILREKILKKRG